MNSGKGIRKIYFALFENPVMDIARDENGPMISLRLFVVKHILLLMRSGLESANKRELK